jgi:hypothetical protein
MCSACDPILPRPTCRRSNEPAADKILFAWPAGIEKGKGITTACKARPSCWNTTNNAERQQSRACGLAGDFDGDFGEDILRKHYSENAAWEVRGMREA